MGLASIYMYSFSDPPVGHEQLNWFISMNIAGY